MLQVILNALCSCLPLAIVVFGILFLTNKARERIESIEINANGLEIRFGKNSRQRK